MIVPVRGESGTGVSRVLYIGEPFQKATPLPYLMAEPLIDVTKVEASTWLGSTTAIMRSMRIYMPRSYEDMVQKCDVVVLSDANVQCFRVQEVQWIADGVEKSGLGLFMPGGLESFGGQKVGVDWGPTRVGDILPVDTVVQGYDIDPLGFALQIEIWNNSFIRSIPWDSLRPPQNSFGEMNVVTQRSGSTRLASAVRARDGFRHPFLVDWDVGKGRSVAMSADWTPAGAGQFIGWNYYGDYVVGLMIYTAQRDVPDSRLLHHMRTAFSDFSVRKRLIISMMEFVDKFGANPRPVEERMGKADDIRRQASVHYVEYEFELAGDEMAEATDLLDQALATALKVKDAALLWVYLTEWCAVSGTFVMSGLVLYSLMIRRRIYREARTTKLLGIG